MIHVSLAGFGAADLTVLDHSLVPFRQRPVYLRLVDTEAKAKNYAAGGFHVSVSRGLVGGCKDPSSDQAANGNSGTKAGVCAAPLGRADLKDAWANAATAYKNAGTVEQLQAANLLANSAFSGEGVEPPRDPQAPHIPEIVTPEPRSWVPFAAGVGLVGAIVIGVMVHRAKHAR